PAASMNVIDAPTSGVLPAADVYAVPDMKKPWSWQACWQFWPGLWGPLSSPDVILLRHMNAVDASIIAASPGRASTFIPPCASGFSPEPDDPTQPATAGRQASRTQSAERGPSIPGRE